jgi:outer membrane protein OmpA-like peptidoglycan-associated protein
MLIGAGLGAVAGGVTGNYMDKQEDELRKKMEASGVTVTRQGDAITLNMPGNITYAFNSDQLNSRFYPVLDGVVEVLKKYTSTMIMVVGHTDSVGSEQVNQDLSVRRAQSVANYLISKGVMAERIMIWGYGETRPVATNATEEGRAANRRAELTIEPLTEK